MKGNLSLVLALVGLVGCSTGPSNSIVTLEDKLDCGMTTAEVAAIAKAVVQEQEVPSGWITHIIDDGITDMYLGFVNDRLESIQVAWDQEMMRVATYQRVDLCGTSGDPMASTRMKHH